MDEERLNAFLQRDDATLVETLACEIRSHVESLHQSFYGYAVLPGESYSVTNLVAAYNCESDLKESVKDQNYFRYCVDEWSNYVHDCFPQSNAIIAELNTDFEWFHDKQNPLDYRLDEYEILHIRKLLRAVLAGLQLVRNTGGFPSEDTFVTMWLTDFEHEIIMNSAKALNSDVVFAEFQKIL